MRTSHSRYLISGYRMSVHIRARYHSDNGFTSTEDGYSRVGKAGSDAKLTLNAVWNGAYKHISSGGDYTWQYKLISKEYVYINNKRLSISKPKGSKNTVYVKKTDEKGRTEYEDRKVMKKSDNKTIHKKVIEQKKTISKKKAKEKYVSKKSYNKMFSKVQKNEFKYAYRFFVLNTIKKSEEKYYSGHTKRKPHGIDNKVWQKAYKKAKKNKIIVYED